MFCNISFLVFLQLAPADIRLVGGHGAPIQVQWNCRTSVSQAVALQSREIGAIGILNTGETSGCFSGMQKMCLYKPDNFAWNGTLPSKQSIVLLDSRGSG
jgi:hypothetical protein